MPALKIGRSCSSGRTVSLHMGIAMQFLIVLKPKKGENAKRGSLMAGLNEPLKSVPQVYAADRKVHAKKSVFTCEQQLHELMA